MRHVACGMGIEPPSHVRCLPPRYEVGWKDLSKKGEAAMKLPMKMHATILITGFAPYFVAEAVGLSFPYLGLAAIDTSYAYSGSTAMLCGMLACFTCMVAYEEFTGRMEGKMFAAYHYAISPVVFFWQCQATTTTFGKVFFMTPHVFTAWTLYIIVTKEKTA